MKTLLLVFLLAPAGLAQYPGGYPGQYPPGGYPPGGYPPGGYPGGPGGYPGGGVGLPIPHKSGKSRKDSTSSKQTEIIQGVVHKIELKKVEVNASDERIIDFRITDATKTPDDLAVGDKVEIEATQDDKGIYTALNIKRTGASTDAGAKSDSESDTKSARNEPGKASKSTDSAPDTAENGAPATAMATDAKRDPDDSGPPTLKRGKPQEKPWSPPPDLAANEAPVSQQPASQQSEPGPTVLARNNAPEPRPVPAADPHAAFIEKARQAASNFLTGLPNYVCQQFTTRYVSQTQPANWQAQDVVSAAVIYEDGKERYQNIQINGKPVKTKIEDTGAWSTGEFGTVLNDLFSPGTAANFRFAGDRSIEHQWAALYDFDVDHPHSHWRITVEGQSIQPAYRGSVWIAKDTARVLRIEMQAVKVPAEFPDDTTEMALDYDFTSLGTEKYLLPVKAEILSCQRGSPICSRNVIEFRNYHKYSGESTITFH